MEKMLEEYWDSEKPATEEALLSEGRKENKNDAIMESRLDKVRKSTKDVITESRLDSEKSMYGGKIRNKAVVKNDVPPLEAKRLTAKPVMEDEKYKRANEKI